MRYRVWRIYSSIWIYWSRIYIRTIVSINFSFMNIFGHSFVSNLFVRIYSDICLSVYIRIFEYSYNFHHKYLFGHSFVSNFLIQIYLDMYSCPNFQTDADFIYGRIPKPKVSRFRTDWSFSLASFNHQYFAVFGPNLSIYHYHFKLVFKQNHYHDHD